MVISVFGVMISVISLVISVISVISVNRRTPDVWKKSVFLSISINTVI